MPKSKKPRYFKVIHLSVVDWDSVLYAVIDHEVTVVRRNGRRDKYKTEPNKYLEAFSRCLIEVPAAEAFLL